MPTTTPIRFDAVTDTIANIALDDYQGRQGFATDAVGSGTWRINYDGVNIAYMARRNGANTFSGGTQTFPDTLFRLADDGDATKLLAFQLSGITTGTTRTLTIPDASGTILLDGSAISLTNTTISAASPGVPNLGALSIQGSFYQAIAAMDDATRSWCFADYRSVTIPASPTSTQFTSEYLGITKTVGAGVTLEGVNVQVVNNSSSGTATTYGAVISAVTASGAGAYSSYGASIGNSSSGVGTDCIGLSLSSVVTAGVTTNAYGLKVSDITGATNNYAIYTGTGLVRFGGQINGTSLALSGLTSGRIPTIGTSGLLGSDAGLTFAQTSSVTTSLTIGSGLSSAAVFLSLDGAAAQRRYIRFRSASVDRWVLQCSDDAESGANAGSPFLIGAYSDAGGFIDSAISIVRAAGGLATLGGTRSLNINGGALQLGGTTRISNAGAVTCTGLSITGTTQYQIPYILAGGNTVTLSANLTFNGTKLSIGASTASNASLNITAGTAPSSPVDGDLWHDSTTKSTATYRNAMTGYVSRCIYSQYAATTQTGIVTNQTLSNASARGTRSLPANFLNVQGKRLKFYLCGHYTTDGSGGNAELRIRFGSTTFRTTGTFALDNNIATGWWRLTGEITCYTTGATGTLAGIMGWEHEASTVVGSEVMHLQAATTTAAVTVDLTAAQTFDVDWTATDAGTTMVCTCFSLYEEA